jgi:hypothetical protein
MVLVVLSFVLVCNLETWVICSLLQRTIHHFLYLGMNVHIGFSFIRFVEVWDEITEKRVLIIEDFTELVTVTQCLIILHLGDFVHDNFVEVLLFSNILSELL